MIESKLPALKEAVAAFHRELAALQPRWDAVTSNEDVEQLAKDEETLKSRLRTAFYDVTSDINSKDNCMSVDISFIIEFTGKFADSKETK